MIRLWVDARMLMPPISVPRAFIYTAMFRWKMVEASLRCGRNVTDAPPLDPSEIGEVAVMIKDRQDGPFALLVSDIAGFRMPQPVEQQWMEEALDTADHSGTPYGAVIVGADGQMLSKAGNRVGADNDASAHAEIRAIGKQG